MLVLTGGEDCQLRHNGSVNKINISESEVCQKKHKICIGNDDWKVRRNSGS